jgi:hypothetical protein
MRFGVNSGPVCGGVLRGSGRARFQLFGDTVNFASSIESTGQKGRIHLSDETAKCLKNLNKAHLLRMREDTVTVKGRGPVISFWLALGAENDEDSTTGEDESVDMEPTGARDGQSESEEEMPRLPKLIVSMSGYENKFIRNRRHSKSSRLVDWNVEILSKILKHIIVRRNALGLQSTSDELTLNQPEGQTVLEEVREIITLPNFEAAAARMQEDPEKIDLGDTVKDQLHDYVFTLASMYRANHFHNYEHATRKLPENITREFISLFYSCYF